MYSRKGLVLLKAGCASPRSFYFIYKVAFADCNEQVFNYLAERQGCRKVIVSLAKENNPAKPGRMKSPKFYLMHQATATPAHGLRTHIKKLYISPGNLAI